MQHHAEPTLHLSPSISVFRYFLPVAVFLRRYIQSFGGRPAVWSGLVRLQCMGVSAEPQLSDGTWSLPARPLVLLRSMANQHSTKYRVKCRPYTQCIGKSLLFYSFLRTVRTRRCENRTRTG